MATACGSRVHASGTSDCLATTASPAQKWLASAASSAALGGRAGQRRDLAILARTGEPPPWPTRRNSRTRRVLIPANVALKFGVRVTARLRWPFLRSNRLYTVVYTEFWLLQEDPKF